MTRDDIDRLRALLDEAKKRALVAAPTKENA